MEYVLLWLILLLLAGTFTAVFVRHSRTLAIWIISILIYIPSYIIWAMLQYLGILPVDRILQQVFGLDSHRLVGTPFGAFVLFAPPLLPSIVLMYCFVLRRKRCGTNPDRAS